jgi:hypothetical protein
MVDKDERTPLEKRADRLHSRLDRLRDDVNDLVRDIEAEKTTSKLMPGLTK